MRQRFVHIQKRPTIYIIGVMALVLVLLVGVWKASRPAKLSLQGELELEEIDVVLRFLVGLKRYWLKKGIQ